MDLGIRGRRAALAAAGSGLGFACAQALVAEGVSVVVCDVDAERARSAAEALGGDTRWLVADLTDPVGAESFVTEAAAALGGLDILLVNGPGPPPGTVLGTPAEAYQAALDRSLLSVVRMCLAAVPHMRSGGWGRIVAITSLGVRQPYPNLALSNTARAGATGFLRTLAREIAGEGVTVNSVQPGLHATERVRSVYGDGQLLSDALGTVPAGRLGEPAELGALVAFLCSEHAGYLTGAAIPLDGGAYQALL
ncbi:SDR family oxidoreductase [Pseudonocardia sp. ICBG1122]|nr:SDR family oxidoreductase [Pseudonocardia pini]